MLLLRHLFMTTWMVVVLLDAVVVVVVLMVRAEIAQVGQRKPRYSAGQRLLLGFVHFGEDFDQVVDADQVAVLVVADAPLAVVPDGDRFGEDHRFGKVDQPHAGVVPVVHEEQRRTDHLVPLEEVGEAERGPDRLQPLDVFGLEEPTSVKNF